MPLIAPVARDGSGERYLNVNADDVAAAVAAAIGADELVFLCDVPGVLAEDGSVIAADQRVGAARGERRDAAEAGGVRRSRRGRRRPRAHRRRHRGDGMIVERGSPKSRGTA